MATIKDVAKMANVSVSTVSLVLNDSNLVKLETRYKVLQAVKELNYTPNQYARSLVTKTKKVIGVVWPSEMPSRNLFSFTDSVDTYLTEMLPSIEKEINNSNYSLLLEHFWSNDPSSSLPFVIKNNRVDGMLLTGGIISDSLLGNIISSNVPTVLVGSRHPQLDYVDTDPERAVYLSTRYLIENGHRNIIFINGPKSSQSSERKVKGFLKAMEESELPVEKDSLQRGDYSGISAYKVMEELWERGIVPTGIVGATDSTVLGALRFLYEKGLYCPRDVSAVGFEDGLLAEYSLPPLTTVSVRKAQIGIEACRVLLNRILKPSAKTVRLIIEPELVIRGSVRHI